ncbi:MAG TPA: ABC transporter permease [Gemmatimonadaceae bacterium]|nr:ABC transporter permease [Gemmatimonadaceae bacterium]
MNDANHPNDARARQASALGRYAPIALRDYASNQGAATVIVILLIGFLSTMPLFRGLGGAPVRLRQVPLATATSILLAILPQLVLFGTIFATNGIVANDRKHGYFRFLFAKPISPTLYYAMTFIVHGIGLVIATLALMGIWAATVRPMFTPALVAVVAIMYVAYGGIGLLCSAAFRFDWVSLVAVLLVANVAWALGGNGSGPLHWLLYALPPVHRTSDLYMMVAGEGRSIPWQSIGWLAGYGVACFLLAMVVIRRRPLGVA